MKNKQCAYWFLTVNENAECFKDIPSIVKVLAEENPNLEYAYIQHNADDECSNIHYHITLYFRGSVKRFSTLANCFVGGHIEQTNQQRYKRTIQYLIHKNNPEKFQYKASDITSNINTVELNDILIGEGYDFELFREDKIFDYFEEMGNELNMQTLVQRFGLSGIKNNYFVIKDLMKDYQNYYLKTISKLNRKAEGDPVALAWDIYSRDLKREYRIYKVNFDYDITFEDFERQEYLFFIDNYEKGLIDIDQIIRKELEKYER